MRLLLVDDHVLFREGLALLLRPALEDATIVEAGTCAEAFALLEREGPFDLILMDLQMPGMSGLDGIAHVRGRHPDVPVVALSLTASLAPASPRSSGISPRFDSRGASWMARSKRGTASPQRRRMVRIRPCDICASASSGA